MRKSSRNFAAPIRANDDAHADRNDDWDTTGDVDVVFYYETSLSDGLKAYNHIARLVMLGHLPEANVLPTVAHIEHQRLLSLYQIVWLVLQRSCFLI